MLGKAGWRNPFAITLCSLKLLDAEEIPTVFEKQVACSAFPRILVAMVQLMTYDHHDERLSYDWPVQY